MMFVSTVRWDAESIDWGDPMTEATLADQSPDRANHMPNAKRILSGINMPGKNISRTSKAPRLARTRWMNGHEN